MNFKIINGPIRSYSYVFQFVTQCYPGSDKRPYFSEKETSTSSAISVQGKKLHTMKTFNRLVARACWRHKCCEHNVEQVSQFFVSENTFIILKMETCPITGV